MYLSNVGKLHVVSSPQILAVTFIQQAAADYRDLYADLTRRAQTKRKST